MATEAHGMTRNGSATFFVGAASAAIGFDVFTSPHRE
jgi:hypothetical protein